MEKEKRKIPEIRFPGFTDDWEQRKLGDVFSERSERSSEGELISVTINSGVVKASELDRKDNSSNDKSNYKKVEVGDIAYNSMRMWQGASGYSSYDGILSPAYTVIIPKEGTDSKFFAYDFKRHDMIQTFKRNSQGLTSDTWNLKFPTLKSVKVMVPCMEEQTKISNFFERLDTTITLHQSKLEVLKNSKQTLLQKMFPKNGENVPELRFPGFTEAWEQRKLNEFMDFSNGINAPKENYGKGRKMISVMDILSPNKITYQNIRNSVSVSEAIESKNKVENGDLIFVRSSEIVREVGLSKAYTDSEYALYSGFSIRGKRKAEYNPLFMEINLNNGPGRKQIERKAGGSTRFNVSQEILNSIDVLMPVYEEQNKIVDVFENINNTIALHQHELEKLKQLKQNLLNKLFV